MDHESGFLCALEDLLDRYHVGEASSTPNFILAGYLCTCLDAWKSSVVAQNIWRDDQKSQDERLYPFHNLNER